MFVVNANRSILRAGSSILIPVLVFAWLVWSCNPVPELDLPQMEDKIVVDGWIEAGDQSRVFLTRNTPYFGTVDSSSLRDLVLSRAMVTLYDGDTSEVLILRKDERFFPPFFYEGNSIYGETGKTYTLTAEYGGKSILAETTVPPSVPIDTSYFDPITEGDSMGYAVLEFTDPAGEKNYYRIYTKRVGVDNKYIPTFLMAIDDKFFDGKNVRLTLLRAPESYLDVSDDNSFRSWDSILIKLCTMDRASYDFWSSYQEEILNSTNPFAASLSEIRSNIQGDGLGIWAGYGYSVDTILPAGN